MIIIQFSLEGYLVIKLWLTVTVMICQREVQKNSKASVQTSEDGKCSVPRAVGILYFHRGWEGGFVMTYTACKLQDCRSLILIENSHPMHLEIGLSGLVILTMSVLYS